MEQSFSLNHHSNQRALGVLLAWLQNSTALSERNISIRVTTLRQSQYTVYKQHKPTKAGLQI